MDGRDGYGGVGDRIRDGGGETHNEAGAAWRKTVATVTIAARASRRKSAKEEP